MYPLYKDTCKNDAAQPGSLRSITRCATHTYITLHATLAENEQLSVLLRSPLTRSELVEACKPIFCTINMCAAQCAALFEIGFSLHDGHGPYYLAESNTRPLLADPNSRKQPFQDGFENTRVTVLGSPVLICSTIIHVMSLWQT